MKRNLTAFAVGIALGLAGNALATRTTPAKDAVSGYVNPAFTPPKNPQFVGKDGGAAGVLSFDAGACIRIATQGTWRYQVGDFERSKDGGTYLNLATGALGAGDDGGSCYWAGTLPPDGGATYYLADGGTTTTCAIPDMVPLTDDKVEGWCFYGNQSQISFITADGGLVSVSERYP